MYHPNQNQMQGQGMRQGQQQPMPRPGMPMQSQQQQMYVNQMPMHQQRPMNMPHGQPPSMGMMHGQQGYQMSTMQMQTQMGIPQHPPHQMQMGMNPEQVSMQVGQPSMEHPFSPQDVKMIPTPQSQQQLLTPQPMSQQPLSQQSMQQPLSQTMSQQPMSQQSIQQPLSQQPLSQQPISQQPLSQQPPSNAPPTPATPQQAHSAAPHQTPMSVPQTGSAQADPHTHLQSISQISQQFPLAQTDPMAVVRNMMLRDLRLAIMELNEATLGLGKKFTIQQESGEKKYNIAAPASNLNPLSVNPQSVNPLSVNPPGSVKSLDEPKSHDVNAENPVQPAEQYKTAMNNFLSVCNNIEANLMLLLETQRQYKKFELMSEIKTPGDIKEFPPHLQNFVESMNEDKGHIDETINYINNLIEKVRTAEKRKGGTTSRQQKDTPSSSITDFTLQNYPEMKSEYMDVDQIYNY